MHTNIERLAWTDIINKLNKYNTDSLLIIVDKKISKQFKINELLKSASVFECDSGENLKTLNMYEECMDFFLEKGVHRKSHMIAIGGGTVSDFAGFVASSLLRGISWSVIPTTLLSMVDAAIGGKTGLNTKHGKNLIGAFHLPQDVFIDTSFLKTLDKKHLESGLGEVLKYTFLSTDISKKTTSNIGDLIFDCALFKNEIVKNDFREGSERKKLNLGHTFGHCIEKIIGVEHGLAVVVGLEMIIDIYGNKELQIELSKNLKILNFNVITINWDTISVDDIMNYLQKDKKLISNDTIEIVIPNAIGDIKIERINLIQIRKDLNLYIESKRRG
jgi:3-dehydroquinate synthetase